PFLLFPAMLGLRRWDTNALHTLVMSLHRIFNVIPSPQKSGIINKYLTLASKRGTFSGCRIRGGAEETIVTIETQSQIKMEPSVSHGLPQRPFYESNR